jgi:ankyrin repeat protein
MEAVYQQYAPAVEVLLDYGADVKAVDPHGVSTMDIAAISNTEVTKLIVEYNGVYGAR